MNSSSSSARFWVVARSSPYIRPTKRRYSVPVSRSNRPMPSGTTPICRFTSIGRAAKSSPSSSILPAVGASSPVSILMVVDLPAPFGPRKPKNCPASTRRLIASTALNEPNVRVSPSVRIATSLIRADRFRHPRVPLYHELLRRLAFEISALVRSVPSRLAREWGGSARRMGWQGRQHGGEFHTKHRTERLAVVTEDFPAMLLHDPIANAQTESRAFAEGLGGVEGIENPMRLANAMPCVRKQDDHATPVTQGS